MKRLAMFLDGTWNTLNNNTNVWRLKSLCDPRAEDQMVYYGQGVGTRLGEKVRGGIGGHGLENEIIDAYSWLVENFELGDEIFIFGFSRGAYAARSLSGLISKCGVLKPGAPLSVEQLYARYRRRTDKTIRTLLDEPPAEPTIEERWVLAHCHRPDVKFVGVWDTVGSLGNPIGSMRRKVAKYGFFDTHLRFTNLFAFQALALDEHRKPFEPTFWTKTARNDDPTGGSKPRTLDQVEQRWFVGAHANVGGGYPSDILAQAPLKWLMDKAAMHGLRFRPGFEMDPPDYSAPIADSYATFGNPVLRLFSKPFQRPIGTEQRGSAKTTSRINETIDGTVFERWRKNADYRPANLVDWAERTGVDPAGLVGPRRARDPAVLVP
jgi:uncharacterized protein (DUF2235 family)